MSILEIAGTRASSFVPYDIVYNADIGINTSIYFVFKVSRLLQFTVTCVMIGNPNTVNSQGKSSSAGKEMPHFKSKERKVVSHFRSG
jgi:hypothetical protein